MGAMANSTITEQDIALLLALPVAKEIDAQKERATMVHAAATLPVELIV